MTVKLGESNLANLLEGLEISPFVEVLQQSLKGSWKIHHVYSYAFHPACWASSLYYYAGICRYVKPIPNEGDVD